MLKFKFVRHIENIIFFNSVVVGIIFTSQKNVAKMNTHFQVKTNLEAKTKYA